MAEKTCPKCAEQIKLAAKVCKHCGHQFSINEMKAASDANVATCLGAVIVIAAGIFALSTCGESSEEKAARLAQESKQAEIDKQKGFHCLSAWDGSHRGLVETVKGALRDPGSFEHYQTRITPKNAEGKHILSMEYGARNGFGGMNRETVMAEVDNATCDATVIGSL